MDSYIYSMDRLKFLERARSAHGYRYSYPSLGEKVRLTDTIQVAYGESTYEQKVVKHLMGRQPEKAARSKGTEAFIEAAIEVWGGKYDYSQTIYKNSLEPVTILYRGVAYSQRPASHLEGMAPEFRKSESMEELKKKDREKEECVAECLGFLKKFKIGHERLKRFEGLEFDFYLPDIRTCVDIEPDMESWKAKQDFCEDSYIELVRIGKDQAEDAYMLLWESIRGKI